VADLEVRRNSRTRTAQRERTPSAPAISTREPESAGHLTLVDQTTVQLPISALSQGIRIRAGGLDEDHVRTLADSTTALPPIVIHKATMTIVDGVHRIAAARVRGQEHVEAVLFDGNVMEAYVLALQANAQHGLPLSRKDRRAAVERLLGFCPQWSDRRVATVTGVSPKTVATIRSRSTEESQQPNRRLGLDGRERSIDPRAGRLRAAELLSEQPTATIRQVAAATGLSPATVHDVRRRLAVGQDPTARKDGRSGSRRPRTPVRHQSAAGPAHAEVPQAELGRRASTGAATSSSTLRHLRADPSVRATFAGRTLLQLFSAQVQAFAEDEQLAQAVPAHRKDLIAQLARQCGDAWLNFASEVEGSGAG
jgi:ParB-like chromosome segregation protein Spo0J